MGNNADQTESSSSRARGRWKLLRNALLQEKEDTTKDNQTDQLIDCHSIHLFTGYQMLQTKWVVDVNEQNVDNNEDCQMLKRVLCDKVEGGYYSSEDLPRIIRVLQAMRWHGLDISLKTCESVTMRDYFEGDMPLGWIAELSQDGSSTVCRIKLEEDHTASTTESGFGIKAYRCCTNNNNNNDIECDDTTTGTVIYIHERRHRRTTLHDLVRHRTTGIDNTGSVCVWDAAQTLAWYVCKIINQQLQEEQDLRILELGAGMAALSSFMILKQQQRHHNRQKQTKIFITDGQLECVENNKISCLLLDAKLRSNVQCLHLPWSLSTTTNTSIQATITLIADCTHFEQYHGELLWTMLHHTAVGGTSYLCQPTRGKSWTNFLALMETINNNDTCDAAATTTTAAALPIVQVQQIAVDELDQKRIDFESKASKNGFRADVHHPYIFSVKKLRTETEEDQKRIIEALSPTKR